MITVEQQAQNELLMTVAGFGMETHNMMCELIANGYIVGFRDPKRNAAFEGKYMVSQPPESERDFADDAANGVFCIVGDDLQLLIRCAYLALLRRKQMLDEPIKKIGESERILIEIQHELNYLSNIFHEAGNDRHSERLSWIANQIKQAKTLITQGFNQQITENLKDSRESIAMTLGTFLNAAMTPGKENS